MLISCIFQDLLKLTPKDHQDRLALQIALTELDTLTNRLNETKRESENRLEVKRLLENVKRHSVKIDPQMTCLIRHDDMIQIVRLFFDIFLLSFIVSFTFFYVLKYCIFMIITIIIIIMYSMGAIYSCTPLSRLQH